MSHDETGSPLDDSHDNEAVFSVTRADAERATRVRTAVAREVGEIDDDRSRARVESTAEDTVTVAVDASDVSALRAATGTWLGLIEAADRTVAAADSAADDE